MNRSSSLALLALALLMSGAHPAAQVPPDEPASAAGPAHGRRSEYVTVDDAELFEALGLVRQQELAAVNGRLLILENRIGMLQNQLQALHTEVVALRAGRASLPATSGHEGATSACTRCDELAARLDLLGTRVLGLEAGTPLEKPVPPPYAPAPLVQEGMVLSPAAALATALPLLADQATGAPRELRVRFDSLAPQFDFIAVAPGEGQLGLDPHDARIPNPEYRRSMLQEKYAFPAVPLALEGDYLIGATEVTNEQFLAVMHGGVLPPRSELPPSYLRHLDQRGPRWREEPVRNISWYEAMTFCSMLETLWASELAGQGDASARGPRVRLPSEVEWEHAAVRGQRAQRFFPWGNDVPTTAEGLPDGSALNLGGAPPPARSSALDRTPEGVWDLASSVGEWCLDAWQAERWSALGPEGLTHLPAQLQSPEVGPGDQVCVRGGDAYAVGLHWFESSRRRPKLPETREQRTGFRIVLVP